MSTNSALDHYEVLGVPRDATRENIRAAYLHRILRAHPDKRAKYGDSGPPGKQDAERDAETLNEAWNMLGDEGRRKAYDEKLERSVVEVLPRKSNALILSLSKFTLADGEVLPTYSYPCRCGALFLVTEDELEAGIYGVGKDGQRKEGAAATVGEGQLEVQCGGCSAWATVFYEVHESDEGESDEDGSNAEDDEKVGADSEDEVEKDSEETGKAAAENGETQGS